MRTRRLRSRWLPTEGVAGADAAYAIPNSFSWNEGRMYAIAFDLDTDALKRYYPGTYHENAYADIRRIFERLGFTWMQGSLYYGNRNTRASHCVLAVQEVAAKHPWFRRVVRDIRMLRIEETDDLGNVLGDPDLPLDDPPPRVMETA